MSDVAVRAEGLVKRYGPITALDGLDLAFPHNSLVGFLGPNGAGKTTTFRVLLGLATFENGSASVLGHDVRTEVAEVVRGVGAIVEGPAVYETLSGRDNLWVSARSRRLPTEEITAVLSQVGLTERATDRASTYSKGMRQRLALGMALLGEPELLLLDEPMDGLDPAGQLSLRELLRWLVDERGKTVVVSSHVLADVERLADYIVVIHRGRLVTEGKLEHLVDESEGVRVVVDDQDSALAVLEKAGLRADRAGEALIVRTSESETVGRVLAAGGLYPKELGELRPSLEQMFLRLTGEEQK